MIRVDDANDPGPRCQSFTSPMPIIHVADANHSRRRCRSFTSPMPIIHVADAKSLELDPSRYRFFAFATTFFAAFFTASVTRFAVGVEFIVPAHEYERHVRHWFNLPKLEGLDD